MSGFTTIGLIRFGLIPNNRFSLRNGVLSADKIRRMPNCSNMVPTTDGIVSAERTFNEESGHCEMDLALSPRRDASPRVVILIDGFHAPANVAGNPMVAGQVEVEIECSGQA